MTFSVLTATYNRAHTLPMVYESLCQQSNQDFEWLIMDDGSSDQTEQLVEQWINEGKLNLQFFKQANGGKHRAINPLVKKARGKFCFILDSDDTLTPDALERLLYHWQQIPESQQNQFAGVSAMCQSRTGELLGLPIPQDILDASNLEILYIYHLSGDRKGFIRTEIMQAHPFPEFENERFLTESLIWQKIGYTYKTRYVNEVVCITDYLKDGLTEDHIRHLRNNPKGTTAYYRNTLDAPIKLPFKVQMGLHAYYVRYALHAGYGLDKIIREGSKHPLLMTVGILAGPLFYLRDKGLDLRSKASQQKSSPLPNKVTTQP